MGNSREGSGLSPDADSPEATKNTRACDFCHRMKMKCIGKENPPCNRCRTSRIECTFDGPRKTKAAKVEDRLKVVEQQMAIVQGSLAELIALQRGPATTTATSPATYPTPSVPPVPKFERLRALGQERMPPPTGTRGTGLSTLVHDSVQSDDEDDPLEPSAVIYNNMLSLAEAARLKADGHLDGEGVPESASSKRPRPQQTFDYDIGHKRARTDDPMLRRALPLQRGDHVSQFRNPMEMGFCSQQKGEALFDLFMHGASVYVPIFDPLVDTWESLCRRSPFAITALVLVGAKIEDAGREPSELQRQCREHAEHIGMHTLFTPVARIEVLQAMIVLSSWGDTSWRPGGHALRIAMDMGLYRCLPYLAHTGMGMDKTPDELEDERQLVVGARLWLALYKSEFEMAFNLGRPALFAAEDTIKHCRRFLTHPLAISTDSRLVAACELLTLRMPLHQPFSIWPSAMRVPNLDEKIEEANEEYATWYKHWEVFYENAGVPESSFLRESLLTQYSHALLHTNSRILHGVHSRRDMALLSEHRVKWLQQALASAQTLVAMAIRGQAYAINFAKANYYTHVGVAFAARMVIRLTSLLPPERVGDVHQTARDLDAVTHVLAQVPGFQFAQQLREIITKAQKRRVLPRAPASASTPPVRGTPAATATSSSSALSSARSPTSPSVITSTAASGSTSAHPATAASTSATATAVGGPFSPQGHQGQGIADVPLDFLLAESLFTSDLGSTILLPETMSWFPYPPIEGW